MDPGRATTLVFTGAGRPGGPSEAEVMAGYARDRLGVPDDRIVLETEARSTAQNLEYTAPIIATATRITIASDPMHAARARYLLWQLWPDLALRLAPAQDYLLLDRPLLKTATAAYELFLAVRQRRRGDGVPPRRLRWCAVPGARATPR